jgi:hypothetical protein
MPRLESTDKTDAQGIGSNGLFKCSLQLLPRGVVVLTRRYLRKNLLIATVLPVSVPK